jgi:hypothetical protein
MLRKYLLIINLAMFPGLKLFAQVDTIGIAKCKLLTNQLKPGQNQYMIYMLDVKSKATMTFWYWIRNISEENRNGEKVIVISQQWLGADTSMYRNVLSINKLHDFSPLYHAEKIKGKLSAYNWYPDKIIGADSVKGNSKTSFKLDFQKPNYNWNLDIETFEMLPLADGKAFAINFYDAGQGKPEYIIYKVVGSEVITTYNGTGTDCWKLYTEGGEGERTFSETFWISKKEHRFIKEEDRYGSGYRLKIRMPVTTPNPLTILSEQK